MCGWEWNRSISDNNRSSRIGSLVQDKQDREGKISRARNSAGLCHGITSSALFINPFCTAIGQHIPTYLYFFFLSITIFPDQCY